MNTSGSGAAYTGVLILAALLVVMGVYPEPLIHYAREATDLFWTGSRR